MDTYKSKLENWFPKLIGKNYKIITYPDKRDYNCVSFSLNLYDRWLWTNESCWIPSIPRDLKIQSFILLYEYYGYEICNNHLYEANYDKIAFYHKNNEPMHASKQFNNMWRSRINYGIIEHELDWLCGFNKDSYGEISFIMKKIL